MKLPLVILVLFVLTRCHVEPSSRHIKVSRLGNAVVSSVYQLQDVEGLDSLWVELHPSADRHSFISNMGNIRSLVKESQQWLEKHNEIEDLKGKIAVNKQMVNILNGAASKQLNVCLSDMQDFETCNERVMNFVERVVAAKRKSNDMNMKLKDLENDIRQYNKKTWYFEVFGFSKTISKDKPLEIMYEQKNFEVRKDITVDKAGLLSSLNTNTSLTVTNRITLTSPVTMKNVLVTITEMTPSFIELPQLLHQRIEYYAGYPVPSAARVMRGKHAPMAEMAMDASTMFYGGGGNESGNAETERDSELGTRHISFTADLVRGQAVTVRTEVVEIEGELKAILHPRESKCVYAHFSLNDTTRFFKDGDRVSVFVDGHLVSKTTYRDSNSGIDLMRLDGVHVQLMPDNSVKHKKQFFQQSAVRDFNKKWRIVNNYDQMIEFECKTVIPTVESTEMTVKHDYHRVEDQVVTRKVSLSPGKSAVIENNYRVIYPKSRDIHIVDRYSYQY
ncbi:hypothetical protein PCE1_002445 [Barthelona sp. PCE]